MTKGGQNANFEPGPANMSRSGAFRGYELIGTARGTHAVRYGKRRMLRFALICRAARNSVWLDERAVRDELRIDYADLDPAVGSTRLLAVARNARVGLAKTLRAHDRWGNSSLHQEVADGFGAAL
jgi:hypothetical protein